MFNKYKKYNKIIIGISLFIAVGATAYMGASYYNNSGFFGLNGSKNISSSGDNINSASVAGQEFSVGVPNCNTDLTSIFTDIPPGHWAYDYICVLYENNIVKGFQGDSGNEYKPDEPLSRAQMAAFIIRFLYGENFSYNPNPYYPDMLNTHWAFKYMQKAKENNIMVGFQDHTGQPDLDINRSSATVIVIRTLYGNQFSYESTPSFSDVSNIYWAFKDIQKAEELDIMSGYGDGTFKPENPITRAQMAVLMAKAFFAQ